MTNRNSDKQRCKSSIRSMRYGVERWPIAGEFTISRGSRSKAVVVVVTVKQDNAIGRGECVPYGRYGENSQSVSKQLAAIKPKIETGIDQEELLLQMPPGAARNAVDCALWDLQAKLQCQPVWRLCGLKPMLPVITAFTISLATPEKMAEQAAKYAHRDLLKIKLGGQGDGERMQAVREAAPRAKLILDANEAWNTQTLEPFLDIARQINADLVEQPLPAGDDGLLSQIARTVPVCADESVHIGNGLGDLKDRYDCINIKLDKAGGLTEAIAMHKQAREIGFSIMIGCMVGTSLAMAPALLLAQDAEFVDLDGPLLLAKDRAAGLSYPGSLVNPPDPKLWG